ncbi:hypothetical protein Dxin01_02217 [Deinococcus xinjiangensis]|uniref:Phenazine biosynthesis PhzC/PhzF protein n=1 Tax=Deinococcus xinjiangensis TaxID=457454 RepID=A0ABP9VEG5_9DEIO
MNELSSGVPYDVFRPHGLGRGGKAVRVFVGAEGDLQARASGPDPLSVFVVQASPAEVQLRVFTPTREKGESDSATVAALSALQEAGQLGDLTEVVTGKSRTAAQLCGGEWLLAQGVVQVSEAAQQPWPDFLPKVLAAHLAATERPNLVLEVATLAELDSFEPDAEQISALGRQTQTTGLVLYARWAPEAGPQRRADVSFRAFGPLKGFLEDAASSNMFACLTGVLLARGLTPPDSNMLRGAQRQPACPALLSAQYSAANESIWVGGKATRNTEGV